MPRSSWSIQTLPLFGGAATRTRTTAEPNAGPLAELRTQAGRRPTVALRALEVPLRLLVRLEGEDRLRVARPVDVQVRRLGLLVVGPQEDDAHDRARDRDPERGAQ